MTSVLPFVFATGIQTSETDVLNKKSLLTPMLLTDLTQLITTVYQ